MATDYSLYTTSDLIEELRKYTSAYALILIKHDEDTGPNAIKTNINCYETSKMQIFGLVAKMYLWSRSRINAKKADPDDPILSQEFGKEFKEVDNKEGKEILDSLKKRSGAGVFGAVFKDNHEVYLMHWESNKGQSMGLVTELHDKIMNN